VLLIDEDPATARLVRLGLHGPRCQVTAAASATEGLSVASRLQPALVLIARRFKNADGFDVAERLRRALGPGRVAVAFLSQSASVVDHFRAIQLGALAYLRKPVEAKRLGAAVDRILTRIEQGDAGHPVRGPAVQKILAALRQIEEEAASGTLLLARPGDNAQIMFTAGEVQQAHHGPASQEDALTSIAQHGDWLLELRGGPQGRIGSNRDQRSLIDAVTLSEPTFEDSTDLSTNPTFPNRAADRRAAREEDETLAERPRIKVPLPFAPESALGTTRQEAEADDSTMVDPTHPLLGGGAPQRPPVLAAQQPTVSDEPAVATVTDRPLDLTSTEEELFDEDVPTPLKFGLADEPSIPTAPKVPPARLPATRPGDGLGRWLNEVNRAPLLLVIPNEAARLSLTRAAQDAGFSVLCVETGREGYSSAIRVRPVAILSDLKVPDMDGRELVAAVRTDFMVRETPILMVSGDELAHRLSAGGARAVDPVLGGLKTALLPRVQLYDRLKNDTKEEIGGRLEPVGAGTLLRTLGVARASGTLTLRHGESRQAEVIFAHGDVCGATVSSPDAVVGPLAMLHLVGFDWKEFSFVPRRTTDENLVPLGNLGQLLETAHQQNNVLLARVYKQGVHLDDLAVDKDALDLYLQELPPDSLEVLIRLVEGEPAARLAQAGVVTPNVLRSIVFDLRRRAVIRPESLRPVRLEPATGETAAPPVAPLPAPRRRWPVVVAAGCATALLAAGGYLAYWHFVLR